MSIKTKLAWFISLTVIVILSLNLSIYYFSTSSQLKKGAEQQMIGIAKQIGETLDSAQRSKQLIEDSVGEKLRIASISAQDKLDPDINNISNEQLVRLSQELGVDYITLWAKNGDDITAQKSSNSKAIGASSKALGYWYTAFSQLFEMRQVIIPQGQKLNHFWSPPITIIPSDLNDVNKLGFYYNDKTNYLINPIVHAGAFYNLENLKSSDAIAQQIIADNPSILEISGFSPAFYNDPQVVSMKEKVQPYKLDNQSMIFGRYNYIDLHDYTNLMKADQTGGIVTTKTQIHGHKVLKSFIPMSGTSKSVIVVNINYAAIKEPLYHQLLIQILISLGLIGAAIACSSLIAGFMIRTLEMIMQRVHDISRGNFGEQIEIDSNNEFGALASQVNAMSSNLHSYQTQLTAAAKELLHTKQYLESFINNTSDAIHVVDLEGRTIDANKAFETMFGWTLAEASGQKLPMFTPEILAELAEKGKIILNGGQVTDYETVLYSKDGLPVEVSITLSGIRDERGYFVAYASIARDIAERKRTEDILRRSEKLSVVGQLAAGVAHEVRNPLTTLRGFVQLMQKDSRLDKSYLNIMLSELDRINLIVSEFLVFAKPQADRYQEADLYAIMNDIIVLLDSEANIHNVQMITCLEPGVPSLRCESNQLKQVLVNVMKNGMEAMPDGGELTLELARESEQNILIRIKDQGVGIPEEDLARLGEPFFTRKAEGNGLGLMISQQIIQHHKGTIQYSSKPGEGTCVEIRIPLS
ncbi:ATP-binding protein [Paenibacillus sp. JDR-2]|uniref:ATP-binding protein n=1 Tax=Paenibacillus sp. (strain JDR-2) TaxID=324057 RepID=UPI000166AE67|nr:ATP-binding protein [Paenibacillus sp. JDR-2]ACT04548.1 PAS/PAC sensor signal transduction histidine kinase [Paenibacillus sp. JDR-2]